MNKTLIFEGTEGARLGRVWLVPLLLPVFFFIGQIIAIVPPIELGLMHQDEIETYPNILYMLFVVFGAPFLIFWGWLRFREKRSLASVGITFSSGWKRLFGRGFLLGGGMAALSVAGIWMLGGYGVETAQDFGAVSYLPILLLMLGFAFQSSVEEILFRGWMLARLSERYGLWVGVWGNAIVFTLMHAGISGDEPFVLSDFAIFFVMTMAFSVFLSFMAVRQKSVWGACAWHAAWNWSYITWFGLPTTGIALDIRPLFVDLQITEGAAGWLTGGMAGPENSAVTTTVLIIGCFLLARGLRAKSA